MKPFRFKLNCRSIVPDVKHIIFANSWYIDGSIFFFVSRLNEISSNINNVKYDYNLLYRYAKNK